MNEKIPGLCRCNHHEAGDPTDTICELCWLYETCPAVEDVQAEEDSMIEEGL